MRVESRLKKLEEKVIPPGRYFAFSVGQDIDKEKCLKEYFEEKGIELTEDDIIVCSMGWGKHKQEFECTYFCEMKGKYRNKTKGENGQPFRLDIIRKSVEADGTVKNDY